MQILLLQLMKHLAQVQTPSYTSDNVADIVNDDAIASLRLDGFSAKQLLFYKRSG